MRQNPTFPGAEGIIIEGLMESLAEYYSAELAEKMRPRYA